MEGALMHLELLMPLWAIIPLFGAMLALCVVMLVRRPRQRGAWLRRTLMVLLLLVVALRPVTPIEGEQTQRMNANVFFVVDRTGSMNAEDYAGEQPRLDGVKADMEEIMSMTEGARYSILSFDSTATKQLPLTTDAGAATAWIDTLTTEPTAYSTGSNVDRPLQTLLVEISEAKREDPDSSVLVYVLADGENTDGQDAESFTQASGFIDGGAVLGYGTAEGGPMKAEGGQDDGEYITGPDGEQGISRDRRAAAGDDRGGAGSALPPPRPIRRRRSRGRWTGSRCAPIADRVDAGRGKLRGLVLGGRDPARRLC
jgi:Ca-activated chloride channel family protein